MGESQEDRRRRVSCDGLEDVVREGLTVSIRCKSCGHTRLVEPAPMLRLARLKLWRTGFIALERHLRCSRCRSKVMTIGASHMPPDAGAPIGPATKEAFERLKRSLRG
jgi:DNA-directed RNA polymerase subunit RPC12/RpoP